MYACKYCQSDAFQVPKHNVIDKSVQLFLARTVKQK